MSTSITATIDITLAPEQIADLFWNLTDTEQAVFFNTLGEITGSKLPFQLSPMCWSGKLTEKGRYVMSLFGEYAQEGNSDEGM